MRRSFVLLVLVVALLAPMPALATPTPTPTETTETHTLVIMQQKGSTGYSVTVSGSVTIKKGESGDSVTAHTANGRVGGLPWKKKSNDSKDVIRYTGQLRDFEYNGGKIRVTLDGKQIDPDSLIETPEWTPTPTTPTATPTPPSTKTSTAPTTTTSTSTVTETETPTETPTERPTTVSPTTTPPPTTTPSLTTTTEGQSGGLGSLGRFALGIVAGLVLVGGALFLFRRR